MHKAIITSTSPLLGEYVNTVEHEDIAMFYATVVGTVQGLTAAGSTITSVLTDKVEG